MCNCGNCGCNRGFLGCFDDCTWIIILIILFVCCGCGNGFGGNNCGCGGGCGGNNGCGGCGCDNGCGC